MSQASREAIAAAASQVETVTVTPYFRQVLQPGQGHVRLASSAPDQNFPKDYLDTWEVLIPLAQDLAAAEKYLERIKADLLAALSVEMFVTSLVPAEITFPDGGSVPGVVITGTREG